MVSRLYSTVKCAYSGCVVTLETYPDYAHLTVDAFECSPKLGLNFLINFM